MFHYRKENYSEALAIINSTIKNDRDNDTLIYYKALMNQLTKNEHKAMKEYQQIIESKSPFKDRALYFLAIIYVKRNQSDMASIIFKKLCHSYDGSIASFAREHIETLRSNQCCK
jgi:tetratricopeptide (TPR) repeat protein